MPDPPQAGEAASQAAIDSMARQNRLQRGQRPP
jgi:hypothetical protein